MTKLREKVEVYEALLHKIQLYKDVTMDYNSLSELLNLVGGWSYAHRRGNGEYSEKEQQAIIDKAFNRIKTKVL